MILSIPMLGELSLSVSPDPGGVVVRVQVRAALLTFDRTVTVPAGAAESFAGELADAAAMSRRMNAP